MGTVRQLYDGMKNVVTRIGTRADPATRGTYFVNGQNPAQDEAMFRTSWLAKKVITIPAVDMVREWRDWQATPQQIEELERAERMLQLRRRFLKAETWKRVYGGSLLIMGIGDENPALPLDLDRVRRGSLRYVQVLARTQVSPVDTDRDPSSPNFNMPTAYRISGSNAVVHPSRCIRFSDDTPNLFTPIDQGWGDPVLMALRDPIMRADSVQASIATLMAKAKTDTYSIPGLTELVSTAAGEQQLTNRLSVAAALEGILGVKLIEAASHEGGVGEKWETFQVNFAGLPDVARNFVEMVAAGADIPMTRLYGKSPDGMNATGASDLENYYGMIRSAQELELRPQFDTLDDVMLRSVFGSRPAEIHYDFAPLWVESEEVKTKNAKSRAETSQIYVVSGLVPDEVMSAAVKNQLIESGDYPGIEGAYAAYDAGLDGDPVDENEDDEPDTSNVVQMKRAANDAAGRDINDAAPRSLYVSRKLLNAAEFIAWAKGEGFATTTPADELHVTVTYSKMPVDWMKMGSEWGEDGKLAVAPGGARIVELLGDKGAAVLLFNSSPLAWRHEEMVRNGASWDYEGYQPHVTITYEKPADLDLAKVTPYRGKLEFGPEIFEEVVQDWEKGVTEK